MKYLGTPLTDSTDKIIEEIGEKNQRDMEEALKKIPQRSQSESENYDASECFQCKKSLSFPNDFTCKFCNMKLCSEHIQLEKHDCKKATPVKHVRKTWLRKYGLNISSGKFKVVCDACGYNSDFSLIEYAEKNREDHIKESGCQGEKVFLEGEES